VVTPFEQVGAPKSATDVVSHQGRERRIELEELSIDIVEQRVQQVQ
jgi:hypothetical protein